MVMLVVIISVFFFVSLGHRRLRGYGELAFQIRVTLHDDDVRYDDDIGDSDVIKIVYSCTREKRRC